MTMKVICTFILITVGVFVDNAQSKNNVGCIYAVGLCENHEECYDDQAFGRCTAVEKDGILFNNVGKELYARYEFSYDDLEQLRNIIQYLRNFGYEWADSYTQCVIKGYLKAVRTKGEFYEENCEDLREQKYNDPLRVLQYERAKLEKIPEDTRNNIRTADEGIVRYAPPSEPFPGIKKIKEAGQAVPADVQNRLVQQLSFLPLNNGGYEIKKKSNYEKSTLSRYRGTPLYRPKHLYQNEEIDGGITYLNDDMENQSNNVEDDALKNTYPKYYQLSKLMNSISESNKDLQDDGKPVFLDEDTIDLGKKVYADLIKQYGSDLWAFQRSERLDVKKPGPYYKVNNYAFKNLEDLDSKKHIDTPENVKTNVIEISKRPTESSHGRMFENAEYSYVPGSAKIENQKVSYVYIRTMDGFKDDNATKIVGIISSTLHVPEQIFSDQQFVGKDLMFKVNDNSMNLYALDISRSIADTKELLDRALNTSIVYADLASKDLGSNEIKLHAVPFEEDISTKSDQFIYIEFKDNIRSQEAGIEMARFIEQLLGLDKMSFDKFRVDGNRIIFRVGFLRPGLNAPEIVHDIENLTDEFKQYNVTITSVGIVDIDNLISNSPTAVRHIQQPDDTLYILAFIVFGVVSAILVSLLTLFMIKRNARKKDILQNVTTHDSDASRDYQELCRGRMSGKQQADPSPIGQRITSLSKESDNSPSSRSSTSSWTEEPMTNMDITTGHMVLVYMEDHLTNKARLDTEWAALCAYEADPCSVAVAQQKENMKKNRYINALPYDHARIILNALSNVSGSDYINASTITDHDPRNPAYIATQGPLENTAIDFWQMIWEQGCVVIVMLTRLVESDVAMCHRYWPQEGSELYNIYEVHLVSEHIWCDDFLVRSFYLKNLKTTETRTVTQFHFLTWPEGGTPPATKPLLEFRRKVNKSFRGRSCPIVVHCSDGVGRSGSYLLLDMVLNRISKGAKEIDIAATLEHIRDQRTGAVSTKQQFQFVLSAVAEEVQAVLRALPQQPQSQDQPQIIDIAAAAGGPPPLVLLIPDQEESVITSQTRPPDTIQEEPASSPQKEEQAKKKQKTGEEKSA